MDDTQFSLDLEVRDGGDAKRMLGAAVATCLGESLMFCLRKARIDVRQVHASVTGTLVRNERGRVRVDEINVQLTPLVAPEDRARMGRCLELFENFCTVTASVRHGITVNVEVAGAPVASVAAGNTPSG